MQIPKIIHTNISQNVPLQENKEKYQPWLFKSLPKGPCPLTVQPNVHTHTHTQYKTLILRVVRNAGSRNH
jgi:hypothetical protein